MEFEKPSGYDWRVVFQNISDKTEQIDGIIFGKTTISQTIKDAFQDFALDPNEFEIVSIQRDDYVEEK